MYKEIKIVLVNSKLNDRQLIIRAFHKSGYKNIFAAVSGKDGLRKIENHQPDIVILDLDLPRKGGRVVIESMAKGESNAPLILMSSTPEKRKGLHPITPENFCSILDDLIKRVMSSKIEIAYVPHTIQDVRLYAQRLHNLTQQVN